MLILDKILRKCPYCRTYKLWFMVKRRTRTLKKMQSLVITSEKPMCKQCLKLSIKMEP